MSATDTRHDPRHAYLEWLHMEARLLRLELWPESDPSTEWTPRNTFASGFHDQAEKPSSRAQAVLRAAGVDMPVEDAA